MDLRKSIIPSFTLAAVFSCGFSTTLHAGDIDYTYAEARYLLDAEVEDEDGDGFRLGGSFRITPDIYLFGSYDDVEMDDFNADVTLLKFGAGYIYPINPTWDANFSLAYANAEVDFPGGDEDEDGFELSAGVRGKVNPQIEVRGEFNYLDLDEDDTYLTVGGDYYFTPNVSAGLELDLGGDYETLSIGARYYFK